MKFLIWEWSINTSVKKHIQYRSSFSYTCINDLYMHGRFCIIWVYKFCCLWKWWYIYIILYTTYLFVEHHLIIIFIIIITNWKCYWQITTWLSPAFVDNLLQCPQELDIYNTVWTSWTQTCTLIHDHVEV